MLNFTAKIPTTQFLFPLIFTDKTLPCYCKRHFIRAKLFLKLLYYLKGHALTIKLHVMVYFPQVAHAIEQNAQVPLCSKLAQKEFKSCLLTRILVLSVEEERQFRSAETIAKLQMFT